ncbi:MAG: tryptophan--tRNA ligase, partial [Candidatus Micrarchaeota archaeon]
LTRDIAFKHRLIQPSSTYNRFMHSLTGNAKMSKSDPMGMITLNDDEKTARKKIMSAKTGGRKTVEEQKKDGGVPEDCMVYEMFMFHLEPDDKKLSERYSACKGGKIMCGECKKQCADALYSFLKEHQEKKKKLLPKARKLLDHAD